MIFYLPYLIFIIQYPILLTIYSNKDTYNVLVDSYILKNITIGKHIFFFSDLTRKLMKYLNQQVGYIHNYISIDSSLLFK